MIINIQTALFAAQFFLASKTSSQFEMAGISSLTNDSKLDPSPVLIYDLSGAELLFYDFYVISGKKLIGSIRCAANKLVGDPIIAYIATPFQKDTTDRVVDVFRNANPVTSIVDVKLICYSYPKIGVLVESENIAMLYCAYTYNIINSNPDLEKINTHKKEGGDYLNYKNAVSEGAGEDSLYDKGLKEILSVIDMASEPIEPLSIIQPLSFRLLSEHPRNLDGYEYEYLSEFFKNNPPAIRSLVLPVPLIGQELKDYCAMATAQMILKYIGIKLTQAEIADYLNYSDGGATPIDQMRGYKNILGDKAEIKFDDTPTWEEAIDALQKYMPFKSGVGLHARVCRGWKRFIYLDKVSKKSIREENYFLINDPYPAGFGSSYWESISIHIYRNAMTFSLTG